MKQIIIFIFTLLVLTSCHKVTIQPQVLPYVTVVEDTSKISFDGSLSFQNQILIDDTAMQRQVSLITYQAVNLSDINNVVFSWTNLKGWGLVTFEYGYFDQSGIKHKIKKVQVLMQWAFKFNLN